MARPTKPAEPNGKATRSPSTQSRLYPYQKQGAVYADTLFIGDHHGFGRYGVVLRGRTITAPTALVSTSNHTI